MANVLIHNTYINEKICGSKYHTYWRLRLPMLLNMMENHGFAMQNSDTKNTSIVCQNLKNAKVLLIYIVNLGVQRASPYACYVEI